MMISPKGYREQIRNFNYEALIKERDGLIRAIRHYEKYGPANEELRFHPSPDVVYQMNLEYLAEVCQLICMNYRESREECKVIPFGAEPIKESQVQYCYYNENDDLGNYGKLAFIIKKYNLLSIHESGMSNSGTEMNRVNKVFPLFAILEEFWKHEKETNLSADWKYIYLECGHHVIVRKEWFERFKNMYKQNEEQWFYADYRHLAELMRNREL